MAQFVFRLLTYVWESTKRGITSEVWEGTSLLVQWVRLCVPNAGGPGSIPGQGTKAHMPQLRLGTALKKKKKKEVWGKKNLGWNIVSFLHGFLVSYFVVKLSEFYRDL